MGASLEGLGQPLDSGAQSVFHTLLSSFTTSS